ncbi:MAG: hypothetical protein ACI9S8_001395 [Chlamydiales bacterium]|jgi:hypothetical protein
MNSQILDESKPISKEEHLKLMIYYIIGLLELCLMKHADELTLQSLKILTNASAQLPYLVTNPESKLKSKEYLDEIGGEQLFNEIANEVKEWIFIYEPLTLREGKQRPKDKLTTTHNHIFLNEGYEAISDLFKRSILSMQRTLPALQAEQVTLGMFRDFLQTGKFVMPLVKPELLASRYTREFETFEQRIKDIHDKLGNFRNRIELVDLKIILDYGVTGLREEWRDNQAIIERIHLEFLGVPKKEEELFIPSFMKKIQKSESDKQDTDESRLYSFFKKINEFLLKISKSPDYDGSPEMEVALGAFINERER